MVYPFDVFIQKIDKKSSYGIEFILNEIESNEILDFLYDHLYPSAYDREYPVATATESGLISNKYLIYSNTLKQKIVKQTNGKRIYLVNRNILCDSARTIIYKYGWLLDRSGLEL